MFSMVVTPMDRDGLIDEEAFRLHLRRMVGLASVCTWAAAGTGQGHALDHRELARIYEIGLTSAREVPVYCNPPEARTAKEMLTSVNWQSMRTSTCADLSTRCGSWSARRPLVNRSCISATCWSRSCIRLHSRSIAHLGFLASVELVIRLCEDYPQIKVVNLHGPDLPYFVRLQDRVSRNVKLYGGMTTLLSTLPLAVGVARRLSQTSSRISLGRSSIDSLRARYERWATPYKSVLRLWAALEPAQGGVAKTLRKLCFGELGFPGGISTPATCQVR